MTKTVYGWPLQTPRVLGSLRIPIVGGSTGRTPTVPGRFPGAEPGELEASTTGLSHCGMQRVIVITSITDTVITIVFLARFDRGADGPATRETAYMNLNMALMSHLQKPPMAPKSTLIAFIVHPTFLFALNLDLPQGLQLPCPCQCLPRGSCKIRYSLVIHRVIRRSKRIHYALELACQGRSASIREEQRRCAVEPHDVHQAITHADKHAVSVNEHLLNVSKLG